MLRFQDDAWAIVQADGKRFASIEIHDKIGAVLVRMDRRQLAALVGVLEIALTALPHTEPQAIKPRARRRR